jgi:hypothetical protein
MSKEIMEIKGSLLEEILNGESELFDVIDNRYEFIGCDHDLWEFTAIIKRFDNTFFSVNWYDNYSCNWNELGLTDDLFELTQVFPKEVLTTVYE